MNQAAWSEVSLQFVKRIHRTDCPPRPLVSICLNCQIIKRRALCERSCAMPSPATPVSNSPKSYQLQLYPSEKWKRDEWIYRNIVRIFEMRWILVDDGIHVRFRKIRKVDWYDWYLKKNRFCIVMLSDA